MSDPYSSEQQRTAAERQQSQGKQTLEMVELERQKAVLPGWQQAIINGLAIVGFFAIIIVFLYALGVF